MVLLLVLQHGRDVRSDNHKWGITEVGSPLALKSVAPALLLRRSVATSLLGKGTIVFESETHPERVDTMPVFDGYYSVSRNHCAFLQLYAFSTLHAREKEMLLVVKLFVEMFNVWCLSMEAVTDSIYAYPTNLPSAIIPCASVTRFLLLKQPAQSFTNMARLLYNVTVVSCPGSQIVINGGIYL